MSLEVILTAVWALLNSAPGIIIMGAVLAWVLKRIFAAAPSWRQYEGTIIAAVKWAEKTIPDDAPDKSAQRLDRAMQYVLRLYELANPGKETPKSLVAMLRQGVQIVHERLEKDGTL